jgi:23S rRNA (adenine1618-N6)-methyltransferase
MTRQNDTKTLHPRNLHNSRYNFSELVKSYPKLQEYLKPNKYGDISIDFSNQLAILALNKALLLHYYNIQNWDIPKNYLCPPIPGRADYIHHIADLLSISSNGKIPRGKNIKGLDIGIGANCIYSLLGTSIYGWQFIGSECDDVSFNSANNIINSNEQLKNNITLRKQKNKNDIFNSIINQDDKFDFTLCNPPFHKSKKEAKEGTKRKILNLSKGKNKKISLNFGGQHNELWCEGGELEFIKKMIFQSIEFKNNCKWFTTLVSKKENLEEIYKALKNTNIKESKTINMQQGQKLSRIVAWRF